MSGRVRETLAHYGTIVPECQRVSETTPPATLIHPPDTLEDLAE